MRQKVYSGIVKKLAGSMALFGIAASGNAFGQAVDHQKGMISRERVVIERQTNPLADLGKGWVLGSSGGLSYLNPNDDSHWFKLSGVIRLDETLFMGSHRDKEVIRAPGTAFPVDLPSSANLRQAEVYMDGGVGQDWEYTLGLSFKGSNVRFTDTWLSYSGFLENNQVFVGRVPGNWFGLENSNSTSWNPFLERSLAANAFYPGDGLGVMTDFWWDMGAITIAAMQPDQKPNRDGTQDIFSSDVNAGVRDRWRGTVRATIAPLHESGDVWHFGISGAVREMSSAVGYPINAPNVPRVAFSVGPDAVGRNTASLLNTSRGNTEEPYVNGVLVPSGIRANNVRMFNVEAARQYGPFMLEGEYTNVYVHRIGSVLYGTLRFDGWNIQTRYMLTGEHHEYDVRDGNFGSVKINNPYGAVELAARYDYINLNDKNVRGGSEHNVTLGLNWFINQQVRLSANYIRASIHPYLDAPRRDLDIIGLRCQIRFK